MPENGGAVPRLPYRTLSRCFQHILGFAAENCNAYSFTFYMEKKQGVFFSFDDHTLGECRNHPFSHFAVSSLTFQFSSGDKKALAEVRTAS